MLFSACEKKQPRPQPAPAVTTTKGILDYSHWNKWVQDPPRIILVSSVDVPTDKLIATQARIFTTLVSPPPDVKALPAIDVQAQLDAVKDSFADTRRVTPGPLPVTVSTPTRERFIIDSGTTITTTSTRRTNTYYDTAPITVPQQDRWDSYRRTVAHANLTNLPGIITQLERKIESDIRDLEYQLTSHGPAGFQAHADTAWLRESMTDLVNRLKKVGKTTFVSPTSPAELARKEWAQFEATELPLIKQVIDDNTISTTTVNPDGSFTIKGRGQPIAVITVAGRQLYFSVKRPGALRFFNMETSTR